MFSEKINLYILKFQKTKKIDKKNLKCYYKANKI
jgi:hypothetical protein